MISGEDAEVEPAGHDQCASVCGTGGTSEPVQQRTAEHTGFSGPEAS